MKKDIHPQYFEAAKISCSCGNTFTMGATVPELKVDICSNCHPLYTGKSKLMDTARRVDRFNLRVQKSLAKQKDVKA